MGQVLELSDDTYHQLADLAQQQQRAPELRVLEADMLPASEYPVVLAYRREPVQRLPGVVRTVREGPRELALTDDERQACQSQACMLS